MRASPAAASAARAHARPRAHRASGRRDGFRTAPVTRRASSSGDDELDTRSAAVVDMFERAATPIGELERAQAALAAVKAMTNSTLARDDGRASAASGSGGAKSAGAVGKAISSSAAGSAPTAATSASAGTSKSASEKKPKPKADTFNPGSDFWTWTPPEDVTKSSSPASAPVPKLQRQTSKNVADAVAFAERVPEASLQLKFQSEEDLPTALSMDFESELAMETVGATETSPLSETPTVELEESATAVRELGADGATQGTLENGARWWRESGEEELEGGKLCKWTLVRGASADGSVEWEEKWWTTSDAFNYREMGAIKSGRDGKGNVWQESWREQMTHDTTSGFSNASKHIVRDANKWGKQADGTEWHEVWDENYWGDGQVKRTCTKKGAVGDGVTPEDGHGNRWTHKWGEEWDGRGGCVKWTDTFADRDVSEGGGPGRAWGEKWEERWGDYAHNGSAGNRTGSTWNDRDGYKFEKTWGEEHWHDGRVHKWGGTTDGSDGWDVWEDSAGWWERAPSFGWDEAVSHSPQLLSVPLRSRAPSTGKNKPTIGRAPGRTIKPPPGSKLQNPDQ